MDIGFIGLGTMGLPMANNLVKKCNCNVIGFDPVIEQMTKFEREGGTSTENVSDIYKNCDLIFICVPSNNIVENIINEIIKDAREGTIIVDLSSTSPDLIQRLYKEAYKRNIYLLDSPVSGGEVGAINGTLVMLCGGDPDVFQKVEPFLKFMGSTITLLGKSGCGDIAKLANNMIGACNIAAVAEALAYAAKAGLNTNDFFHAIKDGFSGSVVLTSKAPKMIAHEFTPSARINIHQKDLKNAVAFAQELGVEIPLSSMVLGMMNDMVDLGCAEEDHSALSKWFEDKMDTKL